ncbi:MAG: hypothetical protein COA41_16660 [Sphingopyxis sp.]|nr:MAG: hypothetical protein COA41_16660 [Sphingopyxis sp.]
MTTETNFRKMLAVAGGLALAVPALSACAEQADDAAVVADDAAEEAADAADVAECAAEDAACAAEDATEAAGDAMTDETVETTDGEAVTE